MKHVFLLFFLTNFYCFSQVGGENIYQFLNIPTSARQIALGGQMYSIVDDINQPLWNPSTLNKELEGELSLNYANYLADVNIGSVSYATSLKEDDTAILEFLSTHYYNESIDSIKVIEDGEVSLLNSTDNLKIQEITKSRRLGIIYGNISYVNYGNFFGSDEFGNETGTFSANDIAITVGYCYRIPRSSFYLGANIKYITSNIENFSSYGIATDVAILYNNTDYPFLVTLIVRNFGVQLKSYNGTQEELPLNIALGGSYQLEHVPLKWYATIDNLQQWELAIPNPSAQTTDLEGNVTEESISSFDNIFRRLVFGAELFPEKIINLRVGYNFRRASELQLQNARTFSGISFGFGIRMKKFKFNYAYSNYHSATNTSTFSLEMNLLD